jgi:hypothetical protein
MKCDASDCSNEATHFETYEDDLAAHEEFENLVYKWCDKCHHEVHEDDGPEDDGPEDNRPRVISEDEYLIRKVMAA